MKKHKQIKNQIRDHIWTEFGWQLTISVYGKIWTNTRDQPHYQPYDQLKYELANNGHYDDEE